MTDRTVEDKSARPSGHAVARLRRAWAKDFDAQRKVKVLPADETVLAASESAKAIGYIEFLAAVTQKTPEETPQKPLHTALFPQPFIGNPESARVILLMLNPGLGPMDYYSELSDNRDASYIEALQKNLRGDIDDHPFFFLNPLFRWHPGAEYWHRRLGWLIDAFVSRGLKPDESRRLVSQNVCCIQSLPYHSSDFAGLRSLLKSLPSVKLAHDAARELASDANRLTIVMRNVDFWNLPETDNVRHAEKAHRRNAVIPPQSAHGGAILQWLQESVGPS
jgi:hypothetical protein